MMGVSLAENLYDDPYDLAVTDPLFLAAAAAAHTGRWSLLDALWWEWHPEEPAPSGSPSPIFRLRALQRRVFAADGDAAGDHDVSQEVRELEAEIAAERAAITETIVAARADLERRAAVRPHLDPALGDPDGSQDGSTAADPGIRPADAEDAAGSSAVRPTRRRLLPALILVAALIAADVLGGLLGNRLTVTGLGAESPPPSAGATIDPLANPAALFAVAQLPKDLPAVAVSAIFEPDSFRYLGSAGWPEDANLAGPSPFYAARAVGNLLCLVAVPEGSGYLSTCAVESAYPAAGLRLYWESADFVAEMGPDFFVEEGAGEMIGDVSVIWGRTGEVSTQLTLRSPTGP
jgi:hypothetical protein